MNAPPQPERVDVLGVGISALDEERAVARVESWIGDGVKTWVNVCTVHTVMECRKDPEMRRIVNGGGLATPDGMPLVWLCRWGGHPDTDRVYGPDLMLALCARSEVTGHRHYFYGGAPDVLDELLTNLKARFPKLVVAGAHAPPFRPPGALEEDDVLTAIDAAKPDIVWVGLGTPKQDLWVGKHRDKLRHPAALIAVGAAFDFHAGRLPQAPRRMQRAGLEWLFRLIQEPRRLAYRYLVYNPLFVVLVLLRKLGLVAKNDTSP